MTDTTLNQHPLSAAFPAMSVEAFAELRADIAANGLRQAITLYDGAVLDGWHRQQACVQTGAAARYEVFEGDADAARQFVLSLNLNRRHLEVHERALIAAQFATLPNGVRASCGSGNSLSLPDAAALLNVSRDSVQRARTVLERGTPEVIAAVEAGEMPLAQAAAEVRAAAPKPARPPKAEPAAPSLILPPTFTIEPRTIDAWRDLSDDARAAHLAHRNSAAKLNRQEAGEDANAIDWAKWTWNPITGCLHSCPYCYARDIAERFAGTPAFPAGFAPLFRADRLAAPLNGAPRAGDDPRERRVFTGSMADLFGRWVPAEWINAVLDVERQAAQWEFLMLTKFPRRMSEFDIPSNAWMGTSVDCQARVRAAEAAFAKVRAKVRWLSVEPMIEPLRFEHLDRFDLLVIGGASPSRETPRWIPPFAWIDDLMRQADAAGCAVFLKSNLYRKEEPGGARYTFADRAPDVFHYLARASDPDRQANAA
jgi:protein gp37